MKRIPRYVPGRGVQGIILTGALTRESLQESFVNSHAPVNRELELVDMEKVQDLQYLLDKIFLNTFTKILTRVSYTFYLQ